jgi:hypothetical protein
MFETFSGDADAIKAAGVTGKQYDAGEDYAAADTDYLGPAALFAAQMAMFEEDGQHDVISEGQAVPLSSELIRPNDEKEYIGGHRAKGPADIKSDGENGFTGHIGGKAQGQHRVLGM